MSENNSNYTSFDDEALQGSSVKDELNVINKSLPYHTRLNPRGKIIFKSNKSTRVQESPLDARSPQEVLDYHGMYKDTSIYTKNPSKIFADLTTFDDFQTAQTKLANAKSKFAELPIDVRARFNHDVLQFSEYVQSPNFDISKVMDDDSYKAYQAYEKEQKAQAEYNAFINSDEYKAQQAESKLREQYEKEKYEAWKASRK